MNNQAYDQIEEFSEEKDQIISFTWVDNPAVQNLLDVVASIIAEEYVDVVRQNPDLFSNNGGY